MKTKMLIGLLAAAVVSGPLLAQAATPPAQGQGPNESDAKPTKATPEIQAVEQLETAYKLARWGRANKSASALVIAARMVGEVGTRAPESQGEVHGGAAAGTAPAKPELTRDALLADARAMANGDRAILSQIASVEGAASKGAVGGAFRLVRDIPANTYWTGTFRAYGGVPLRVAAVGDGDTDVDIELFDAGGHRVCHDTLTDSAPVCQVTPAWTGSFTLKVSNLGDVWTRTVILTN